MGCNQSSENQWAYSNENAPMQKVGGGCGLPHHCSAVLSEECQKETFKVEKITN